MAKQSGVALVIGLLLLLVITLIAVSGLTGAANQTKMASNAQQYNQTFQAAEGGVSATLYSINGNGGIFNIEPLKNALNDTVNGISTERNASLSDNSDMEVNVTVTYQLEASSTPGFSLSADENAVTISPHMFSVRSQAQLTDTGAQSIVEQGIMYE